MHGYDASTYGERFADIYDEWYPDDLATGPAVNGLAALAGVGPVLEMGVGTGRLAVPLAERGLEVWGLDASRAMLERLAAKPGGGRIHAVLGDMGGPLPGGPYGLVFIASNTLFNLASVPAQAQAFVHVAAVLNPGGRFVVEAFVPSDPPSQGSAVELRHLTADRVVLSVHRSDTDHQTAEGSYIEFTEAGGVRLRPWSIRYSTPSELDEMARNAGLEREQRYGGWDSAPFSETSPHHVSIYRRPV